MNLKGSGYTKRQSGPDRNLTSLGSYLPGMTELAALWASGHTARALLASTKPDCEFWALVLLRMGLDGVG
jgi:hypothetical protein